MNSMADNNWYDQKEEHIENKTKKLLAKKKEYRCRNNVSAICRETPKITDILDKLITKIIHSQQVNLLKKKSTQYWQKLQVEIFPEV